MVRGGDHHYYIDGCIDTNFVVDRESERTAIHTVTSRSSQPLGALGRFHASPRIR